VRRVLLTAVCMGAGAAIAFAVGRQLGPQGVPAYVGYWGNYTGDRILLEADGTFAWKRRYDPEVRGRYEDRGGLLRLGPEDSFPWPAYYQVSADRRFLYLKPAPRPHFPDLPWQTFYR